uniref:Uncharacterized protein n=1 Tax=Anopheles dirus TaxID=7168 RepID=A0A182NCB9_9DIPT
MCKVRCRKVAKQPAFVSKIPSTLPAEHRDNDCQRHRSPIGHRRRPGSAAPHVLLGLEQPAPGPRFACGKNRPWLGHLRWCARLPGLGRCPRA